MSESRTDFGKWWDEHADDKWPSEVDIAEDAFTAGMSLQKKRDADLAEALLNTVAALEMFGNCMCSGSFICTPCLAKLLSDAALAKHKGATP